MENSNRSQAIIRNGTVGIVSQCITMVLSFVMRSVFLKYIGEEMLGVNTTFASVLDTMSLSELGFQSAIIFMLYKPLREDDKEKINAIINLLKSLYRYVGIFFLAAAVVMLPFLKYILKGVTVTPLIWLFFLMQTSVSAFSYFLAYPRSLLYADQKEYLSKLSDMVVNTLISVVTICSVIWLRSYGVYLGLRIAGVVISNLIVFRYYRKAYPYIRRVPLDKSLLREVWGNTKNIFFGRLAGLLYKSTANLMISSMISTVMVTFYGNYQVILTSIRTLVESAMTSMIPIIGNSLVSAKNVEEKEHFFKFYSHVRYLIALVVVIPFVLLVDQFIGIWLGPDYIMGAVVKCMMAADLYIHLVHTPTYDFITASGMFREARNLDLFGALLNIGISLVSIKLLGFSGVLVGTVVSQIVFWIGRSYLVYKKCLATGMKAYLKYWAREGAYLLIFLVCLGLCYLAVSAVPVGGPVGFVIGGVICEAVACVFILGVLRIVPENKALLNMVSRKFKHQ